MFKKNVSGQFLYFGMVSSISGNVVTGISGAISGRRSIDGGSQTLLSGFVGEVGGGQYVASLFDFDTNGNNIGFLFTASGCAPVNMTMTTDGSISGLFVTVPKATISGVIANSGIFATVPTATISGVTVTVIKENISGVVPLVGVGFISGLFVTVPIATISGVNVVATATVDPASISGAFVTVPKATISGVIANSGLFVSVPPATISGTNAIVPPDNLSGVVPSVMSGLVWLASGHQTALYSGQLISPYSGQISKFSFASGVIAQEIPQKVMTWDPVGTNLVASGQSGRCPLNALRKLTNKWDFQTSGYLTVYQEDDTTIAYRQAVTSVSGATPVTSLDTQ